ncbi:PREDICTED: uncharacterized protein LOC104705651 [Camelina sativa]|uniref:Uncharacterized protein LOC104705651 n=1 Tax=Camelina sativa TaxID=90675 RepID=A0ABM0T2N0_CAMSA|nr:PREDICTED: uncharacterized protein LOC104705651 [Camelina sativa]
MKKAAEFVKQIINMLTGLAKDKTKELKRKTRAFKTRLVIFSLLHNRHMVMSSLSNKLKTNPTSKKINHDNHKDHHDQNMVVVYSHIVNAMSSTPVSPHVEYQYAEEVEDEEEEDDEEEEGKYPDLRHSLFEAEGSVIEMVKHSKEDKGEEFKLEDEIDKVADLFISRFHRQMWLQKQLSLESIPDTSSPIQT